MAAGTISNRRWLTGPVMTDAEVSTFVNGTRLTQGGQPVQDNRTLQERLDAMARLPANTDEVRQNIEKIQAELRRQIRLQFAPRIGEAELNKQKGERTRQLSEQIGLSGRTDSGPLGTILGYAGLPEVKPRIKGGKTRKGKKSKRKTHKRK